MSDTVDALLTVQEKIYQAWRDKKLPSLVTFDLKEAFNGVATDILLSCARAHRIPEDYVRWIQDFCTERSATITVNGYTSVPKFWNMLVYPKDHLCPPSCFNSSTLALLKA